MTVSTPPTSKKEGIFGQGWIMNMSSRLETKSEVIVWMANKVLSVGSSSRGKMDSRLSSLRFSFVFHSIS
ncbi:Uncharacterized protein TCM_024659 [Theobroma cacao]|uniref:Uncharacterized protein n=1 Tax=Theobroma cacao TaxID=3641 RepID=A0A061EWT1_THECC|nr:Uncharacterized protein TCM_024659 [Theobroma cacao]